MTLAALELEGGALPDTDWLIVELMCQLTGYVQANGTAVRRLQARKVHSSLFFLSAHPLLPPALRHLCVQWRNEWAPLTDGVYEKPDRQAGTSE